jgi:hypothetical protein
MNLASPTIADLRAEHVQGARVWCLNSACQHYGVVTFKAIGHQQASSSSICRRRAASCAVGTREVQVMPDWPEYRAREWARTVPACCRDIREGRATKSLPAR